MNIYILCTVALDYNDEHYFSTEGVHVDNKGYRTLEAAKEAAREANKRATAAILKEGLEDYVYEEPFGVSAEDIFDILSPFLEYKTAKDWEEDRCPAPKGIEIPDSVIDALIGLGMPFEQVTVEEIGVS